MWHLIQCKCIQKITIFLNSFVPSSFPLPKFFPFSIEIIQLLLLTQTLLPVISSQCYSEFSFFSIFCYFLGQLQHKYYYYQVIIMPLLICREIKVIKNPNETADLLILCLLLQIIFMSKIAINNYSCIR